MLSRHRDLVESEIDSLLRIRRVKCDETKPACLQCTSTKRRCDGYPSASAHNTARASLLQPEGQTRPDSTPTARVPLETTSFYSLPFKIPGSQNDRQLFHYFCIHASRELAGFSCEGLDFWGRIVLQCSHHEPVVRSALLALASAHRNFATKQAPADGLINPLKEYNRALRRLRKYISSEAAPNKKVILVCCALFYCFENTRGEQEWALIHLETALNLSKEPSGVAGAADSRLVHDAPDNLDTTTLFFSRLDAQASSNVESRLPSLTLVSQDERFGQANCVPPSFTRLSQADVALNKLENWTMHFVISNVQHQWKTEAEIPSAITCERRELKRQFERWEAAFSKLLDHTEAPTDKDKAQTFRDSVAMLKVQRRCYSTALLTFCHISDADWANVRDECEEILEEVELVLRRQSVGMSPGLQSFSCHGGVVTSLWFVSCKCREARIRQKALSLLAATTRREGLWDAQTMGGVVRNMMALELNGEKFDVNGNGSSVEQWAAEVFDARKGGYHTLAKDLNVTM